jgi:hypothetical protein
MRDAGSGVEAISASVAGHAYDLHRHDDWLVGVTDHGVQDFFCRGARRRSTPDRVILIEPEEAHDGQAGGADGFAYSMLYLPRAWLRAGLNCERDDDLGFRFTLADDAALGVAIRTACTALTDASGQLERDAALDAVLLAVAAAPWLHGPRCADGTGCQGGAADRFQLARAFRAAYGSSPHAWLVQMRLLRARQMLARGERPADVAAGCGFADQSHLGRWFRRAYGVTPAAYRACCTGVPDAATRIG